MQALTVLVKPASSLCDMRCRYCFYHDVAAKRETPNRGMMPRETASLLIRRAFEASPAIQFAFQGGEPGLAGLDFYRFFVEEVRRLKPANAQVGYTLQTNGLSMTEEFAAFLAQEGFLVGLSLDGPQLLHDGMRVDSCGQGTHVRAMRAAHLLRQAGVALNILCVVHAETARNAELVYRFFCEQGFDCLQFIPCLNPLGEEPFGHAHSLTPELYADFLIRLFDLWAGDIAAGHPVSIRFFDNLLAVTAGYPPEQCGMSGRCAGQFVVEADGSLYPCDFYCTDNRRIGSIAELSLEQAYMSPVMQRFLKSSVYRDEACRTCSYFALCRGGCRRDRDALTDGAAGPNRYCGALKRFYSAAAPRLPGVLAALAGQHTHRRAR